MEKDGYWSQYWRRRLSRRRLLKGAVLGGAAIGATALVGCENGKEVGPATPTAPSGELTPTPPTGITRGGTILTGNLGEDSRMDPTTLAVTQTPQVPLLYSRLVEFDDDGKLIPGLATEWEVIDETTVNFVLRPNVFFHDGSQFKSSDITWNVDRHKAEEFGSPASLEASKIASIASPDDLTATFNLVEPFSPLFEVLTQALGVMGSPTSLDGKDQEEANLNPVGAGPFKLVEWQPDVKMRFERHAQYWQEGLPYVDAVEMVVLKEYATFLASLETGAIYATSESQLIADADLQRFEGMGFRLYTKDFGWARSLRINADAPPVDNPKVRQAMAHALNRQAIVEAFMAFAQPAEGLFGPAHGEVYDPDYKHPYPYDPQKSRQLLEAAGFPDGVNVEIMGEAGGFEGDIDATMQAQLTDAGIKVDLATPEGSLKLERLLSGNYQILSANFPPNPVARFTRADAAMHSRGSANFENYSNPEVDRILEESWRNYDQAARIQAYRDINRLAMEDAVWLPIYYPSANIAYAPRLQGVTDNVDSIPRWTAVWIKA